MVANDLERKQSEQKNRTSLRTSKAHWADRLRVTKRSSGDGMKDLHSCAESDYKSLIAIVILFNSPLSKREKAFKQRSGGDCVYGKVL